MYSKEQRTKALRVYHRIGSVTETVRRLGYPSREHLYAWIRKEASSKQERANLNLINASDQHIYVAQTISSRRCSFSDEY